MMRGWTHRRIGAATGISNFRSEFITFHEKDLDTKKTNLAGAVAASDPESTWHKAE
jgi:hypothetical protein